MYHGRVQHPLDRLAHGQHELFTMSFVELRAVDRRSEPNDNPPGMHSPVTFFLHFPGAQHRGRHDLDAGAQGHHECALLERLQLAGR